MAHKPPPFKVITRSPEETKQKGERLVQTLNVGDCLGLIGGLGAGKTVFVKGMAKGLGIDEALVHSPSYTIMERYPGKNKSLLHVDLYRLDDFVKGAAESFGDLGLMEALAVENTIGVIEWYDRIQSILPVSLIVQFKMIDEKAREIKVQPFTSENR